MTMYQRINESNIKNEVKSKTESELELKFAKETNDGTGYVFLTTDKYKVLSADKVIYDEYEEKVKRKIGVSLSSGCNVGCIYCFTNNMKYRPLSKKEIIFQAEHILSNRSFEDKYYETKIDTKISFKQMGDPLLNPSNTIDAIIELYEKHPDFQYVVSTCGPKTDDYPVFLNSLKKLLKKEQM